MAYCRVGGYPGYNSGMQNAAYVKMGGIFMKVIVMKLPKFFSGITKAIFRIK